MTKEQVEKAVAAYFAAIRARDPQKWANTFAEDGVSHDPVGTPPMHGRDALRQFMTSICGGFDLVDLTEKKVFVSGNGAAVVWKGRVVSKRGRAIDFEGVDVLEVNSSGLIQTVHAYWDPGPVMAEMAAPAS